MALKSAAKQFRIWADANGIAVQCIEHVATFEDWDKGTEVHVFFPTEADYERHRDNQTLADMESLYGQFLIEAGYPLEQFPVTFYFDSHENVVKNFEGNYFYRLR
jgi:hypothetical protein